MKLIATLGILFLSISARCQDSPRFTMLGSYLLVNDEDQLKYNFDRAEISSNSFQLFRNNVVVDHYVIESMKEGFFVLKQVDFSSTSQERKKMYLRITEISSKELKIEFGSPSSLSTLFLLKN